MEKKAEHEMKTRFRGLEFGFGCGGGGVGGLVLRRPESKTTNFFFKDHMRKQKTVSRRNIVHDLILFSPSPGQSLSALFAPSPFF